MKDFAHMSILGDADVDRVANVLANLLQEVVALSERVAELEGSADPEAAQKRIDAVIERVMGPLA